MANTIKVQITRVTGEVLAEREVDERLKDMIVAHYGGRGTASERARRVLKVFVFDGVGAGNEAWRGPGTAYTQYHLRRTGLTAKDLCNKGLEWLETQPTAAEPPSQP